MAGIPNLLLVFLFFSVSSAATNCSYTCGNQTIRFPFSVTSGCGYPGFSLTCKAQETLLSFPGSGDFLVREINYTTQSIRVSDQGNCLPRRLIGFNLSGSPFLADFSANSTLYSCPKQLIESLGLPTIACLGNSTHSVVALLNGTVVGSTVTGRCQKMDTWMTDVVELRWDLPQCQDCEANNGTNFRWFKARINQRPGLQDHRLVNHHPSHALLCGCWNFSMCNRQQRGTDPANSRQPTARTHHRRA